MDSKPECINLNFTKGLMHKMSVSVHKNMTQKNTANSKHAKNNDVTTTTAAKITVIDIEREKQTSKGYFVRQQGSKSRRNSPRVTCRSINEIYNLSNKKPEGKLKNI